MIGKIKYRSTKVSIEPRFKDAVRKLYGDRIADEVLTTINSYATKSVKSESKFRRFFDRFRTHTKLYINLFTDQKGDFKLQATRDIGKVSLKGYTVPVKMLKTYEEPAIFESFILKSKEGILEKIAAFRRMKKKFKV